MMVARGFATNVGKRFVSIYDPWPVNIGDERDITYDDYVQGANHTHWNDFYAVSPSGGAAQKGSATVVLGRMKIAQSEAVHDLEVQDKKLPLHRGVDFRAAVVQSQAVANQSLDTFRKLTAAKDRPGAGNGTIKLGDPFPLVWIGLNELRQTPAGQPQYALRNNTDQVLYPIQALDGVKSGVTIQKKGDNWEDVSYGNVALTKQLVKMRQIYADEHKTPISNFYVVSIPALNMYFIATKEAPGVIFIPVIDDPSIGVKAGVPQKAADVMPKLVDAARKHNGLPR